MDDFGQIMQQTLDIANALQVHGDEADALVLSHEFEVVGAVEDRGLSDTRCLMDANAKHHLSGGYAKSFEKKKSDLRL